MPFDGNDASLRNLAGILRDRTQWPPYFRWDYSRQASCAIGLSVLLWRSNVLDQMPASTQVLIACRLGQSLGLSIYDVRPEYVADAIDLYLTFGEVDPPMLKRRIKLTLWDRFHRFWRWI